MLGTVGAADRNNEDSPHGLSHKLQPVTIDHTRTGAPGVTKAACVGCLVAGCGAGVTSNLAEHKYSAKKMSLVH